MRLHRLAIALLCLALGLDCGGEPETPEAQVRRALAEMEAAVEAGDVGAFKEWVSERYRDELGHDRRSLAAYLTFQVLQNQRRHLVVRVREIAVRDGALAEVSLHAGLAGRGGAQTLRADVYQVDVDLADEGDGEWRVVWAQWFPAPATDLL